MKNKHKSVQKSQLWLELDRYLGSAIQIARILARKSQEDLASDLSTELGKVIRQSYISRVEKGHCRISIPRLGQFSKILDLPPHQIVHMAESIAENQARPPDELLREIHTKVARELAQGLQKNEKHPLEKLLLAFQDEVKSRLSSTKRLRRSSQLANGRKPKG